MGGLLVHTVRLGLDYLVGDVINDVLELGLAIVLLLHIVVSHYLKHQDAGAP